MKKRLKEIRLEKELSQAKFAKQIGIPQSTYAMFETGDRDLKDIHIKQICSEFDVNEEWLRTGKGEMFIKPDTFSIDEYARKRNLTQLELDIIKNFIAIEPEVRQSLLSGFKALFNIHTETPIPNQSDTESETSATQEEEKVIPRIGCKEAVYNEPTAIDYDDPDIKEKMEAYGRELTEKKKVKRLLESKPTKETEFGNLLA